jgi:hypothetical protein
MLIDGVKSVFELPLPKMVSLLGKPSFMNGFEILAQ